jgi:hypothetical protein
MVKADRFKRKLSSLLCDGESKRLNDNKFLRKRYKLFQLSRCKAYTARPTILRANSDHLEKGIYRYSGEAEQSRAVNRNDIGVPFFETLVSECPLNLSPQHTLSGDM